MKKVCTTWFLPAGIVYHIQLDFDGYTSIINANIESICMIPYQVETHHHLMDMLFIN